MKTAVWVLVFPFLMVGCRDRVPGGEAQLPLAPQVADTLATVPIESVPEPDSLLDGLASYLAGMPQKRTNRFSRLESEAGWQRYSRTMDSAWGRMDSLRLRPMVKWRESELSPKISDSLWLFYPFSGPDFLHAQVFYPHARGIIMAALEPVIELPDVTSLAMGSRAMYLDTLGRSLRDLFGKSYFITLHMMKDFRHIRGVLPVFCFFLKRSGQELLGLEFLLIDSAGRETMVPYPDLTTGKSRGFRLTFRDARGGMIRDLYYFSVDISDDGLAARPGLMTFIRSHAPFNTFIKSASYLMHHPGFEGIRDNIVSVSASIFEDDTGVPYRYLKKPFKGRFYGEYVRPVRDFKWLDKQPDLDSAFQSGSQPLPFSLGYHWNTRKQHYLLFTRKPLVVL